MDKQDALPPPPGTTLAALKALLNWKGATSASEFGVYWE
jgi:hypothetical protein